MFAFVVVVFVLSQYIHNLYRLCIFANALSATNEYETVVDINSNFFFILFFNILRQHKSVTLQNLK